MNPGTERGSNDSMEAAVAALRSRLSEMEAQVRLHAPNTQALSPRPISGIQPPPSVQGHSHFASGSQSTTTADSILQAQSTPVVVLFQSILSLSQNHGHPGPSPSTLSHGPNHPVIPALCRYQFTIPSSVYAASKSSSPITCSIDYSG